MSQQPEAERSITHFFHAKNAIEGVSYNKVALLSSMYEFPRFFGNDY